MCGRFALHTLPLEVVKSLGLSRVPQMQPRYNIAPTTTCPVLIVNETGEREIVPMRWGLIPSWAKDAKIGNRMINARCETVAEKPAFKHALRERRCLVPANGFFEWKKVGSRKQPYYIQRADGEPLMIAGLWERWTDRETGEFIRSFTILTKDAEESVREVHDRMPVVLDNEQANEWLDQSDRKVGDLATSVQEPTRVALAMHPVSTVVNRPENDDASLIAPEQTLGFE